MPENLIKKYPLNTWIMEMENWYKLSRLVVSNRITNGNLYRRPFFTKVTATLLGQGVVFYFPGTEEGPTKFWQPDSSHHEVNGVLVLNSADLDDLRRSHGLPYLPPYFEFEVFDDLRGHHSQSILQKWQEIVVRCYTEVDASKNFIWG